MRRSPGADEQGVQGVEQLLDRVEKAHAAHDVKLLDEPCVDRALPLLCRARLREDAELNGFARVAFAGLAGPAYVLSPR